jgi:RNA polymerase sigma-70 factor (ECF subfamily)
MVAMSGDSTDEELARRVQREGDREALERLVRRYVRPVHAVIAGFLNEPADIEDAAQETFLKALRRLGSYQPTRPFAPWLYQIARNTARDHGAARTRGAAVPLPAGGPAASTVGPDALAERAELRDRVAQAIEALPEQRRTAFRLHDVDGFTAPEIGRLMGLAVGTVRSHVHYARRALRAALGKGGLNP